jgi:hypothetical protein
MGQNGQDLLLLVGEEGEDLLLLLLLVGDEDGDLLLLLLLVGDEDGDLLLLLFEAGEGLLMMLVGREELLLVMHMERFGLEQKKYLFF